MRKSRQLSALFWYRNCRNWIRNYRVLIISIKKGTVCKIANGSKWYLRKYVYCPCSNDYNSKSALEECQVYFEPPCISDFYTIACKAFSNHDCYKWQSSVFASVYRYLCKDFQNEIITQAIRIICINHVYFVQCSTNSNQWRLAKQGWRG